MSQINLEFKTDDTNLNLSGVVTFRREVPISRLRIVGLAEWRHVPANILHIKQDTIMALNLAEYGKNFSKIGLNYIGLKANSDILLSHAVRAPKDGLQRVQKQLSKFFKAIGASSVKFKIEENEQAAEENNDQE